MRLYVFSVCAHLFSAILLAVLLAFQHSNEPVVERQVNWPSEFEGQKLLRLELTPEEVQFLKRFPGSMARFNDGEKELIFRYVEKETRMLHPAVDCLRASGYQVAPLPMREDAEQSLWNCTKAVKGNESLRVCERIYDQSGNSYSDVSAWYWAAILNQTQGPWWAVTTSESLF